MDSAAGSSSTTSESRGSHHCSFEHVELKGRNVGASMSFLPGSAVEPKDSLCINIYVNNNVQGVNNNVQGVNNSLLMDSEVKMRDGGVRIYLHGLNIGRLKKRSKKKTNKVHTSASTSGFLWMLVLSVFAFLLFLSLP